MTHPLPPDQPLWSATLVTGLEGDACALIVVFHHVLADGMGGLAVLANLVDGVAGPPPTAFPRRKPSWRRLAQDAAVGRLHTLAHVTRAQPGCGTHLANFARGRIPGRPAVR